MAKTVTFSFSSTEYKGTEATETFTFEELGLEENVDIKDAVIEQLFEAWFRNKINYSYSIVIQEE